MKRSHNDFERPPSFKTRKSSVKHFVSYYIKRIIHYLTLLQGIMTIFFLLMYFQSVIDQNIMDFYLYFSITVFIAYGFMILGIHFLEKPHIDTFIPKPSQIVPPIKESKLEIPDNLLQGKTLQVYWYFFTHRQAGVREIQRALNISSSGTVSYQISKLLKAGVISKTKEEEKYSINEEIKGGILKLFIRIGTHAFPRISLYLILYIIGFIMYFILFLIDKVEFFENPFNLLLLIFLVIGTLIFIFETFKIQKLNPIK